ncbi:peptidoglycan-binding domain-containing protein [Haloimpatiens massiliensis]|uniref:peptidoglycan-binding domain-containing protein n=1 Tax=Haloimpatiens massiliensis TaxID=1658110 RepID=UPI000C82794D|nr:peptidoglycan-binding protein [Haloimpatiens massiliensis]
MPNEGTVQVQVFEGETYIPIEGAKVSIVQRPEDSTRQLEETTTTDTSGLTNELGLNAPSLEFSMKPSDKLPYSFCDIRVEAPGYRTLFVKDCQIYPDSLAVQQCKMEKVAPNRQGEELVDIPPNTLVGNYPPKIPEDPNKEEPKPTGGVVLPEPVVPEFIVVHAGVPNDQSAPNYTVRYKDYIKNVASSEIFATWPETTIRANIYCIISFTLNRIYTEWYRGKGKNFDITNSTAYDHAFTYRRNIYANISRIVDGIFSTYAKRPTRKQPLLTQYCDGVKVQCPGWLTQWGSKYLGDEGKVPYEILTRFYGANLEFQTAKQVRGIPMSYPGYVLKLGSSGEPVRTIQTYLNRISQDYPAIPKVIVDGIYGQSTKNAVTTFQKVFYLPPIGVVDYPTWYKISDIYVAVTKIAELQPRGGEKAVFIPPTPYTNLYHPTIEYPI